LLWGHRLLQRLWRRKLGRGRRFRHRRHVAHALVHEIRNRDAAGFIARYCREPWVNVRSFDLFTEVI
jgi:hypothetical protein